jgi:hypothetical protein
MSRRDWIAVVAFSATWGVMLALWAWLQYAVESGAL